MKETLDTVIDASFRLHGEFYAEKYSKIFLLNPWNVSTRISRRRKENNTLCTPLGRDNQITTSAQWLGIMYDSYGFSGDLIQTIN